MQLIVLKAGQGDSIIIRFLPTKRQPINILIDGGNKAGEYASHLKVVLSEIAKKNEVLNLAIITHLDQDHIKGINYLNRDISINKIFSDTLISQYWFNIPAKLENSRVKKNFDVSLKDMQELVRFLLTQPNERWNKDEKICSPKIFSFFGASITILSPTLEGLSLHEDKVGSFDIGAKTNDYSLSIERLFSIEQQKCSSGGEALDKKVENATSIAFLFEQNHSSLLFLGDAIPSVIESSVQKVLETRNIKMLEVDVIKLSHHGSSKSISFRMLELIKSNRYIISGNGTKAHLPNKSTFAKILCHSKRDFNEKIFFTLTTPTF